MGLQVADPDLKAAHAGGRIVTPSGMVLDGSTDAIEAPMRWTVITRGSHDTPWSVGGICILSSR
jgi:hypothetical protein